MPRRLFKLAKFVNYNKFGASRVRVEIQRKLSSELEGSILLPCPSGSLLLEWFERVVEKHEIPCLSRRGPGLRPAGCLLSLGLILFIGGMLPYLKSESPGEGAYYVLVGIGMIMAGIFNATRAPRLRRAPPGDPTAGFPWNPAGARDETGLRALGQLRRFGWLVLLLAAAHGWAFFFVGKKNAGGFALLIAVLYDVIAVGVLVRAIFLLIRFRRFGSSMLYFDRFPFFLGGCFDARLKTRKPIPASDSLIFTLRCVKETTTRGGSRKGSSNDVAELIYSQEKRFEPGGVHAPAAEIPVRFELPSGDYGTDFSTDYPRYWELTVQAKILGPDYFAIFLVPIFSKGG